jgi:hypothetical protein
MLPCYLFLRAAYRAAYKGVHILGLALYLHTFNGFVGQD